MSPENVQNSHTERPGVVWVHPPGPNVSNTASEVITPCFLSSELTFLADLTRLPSVWPQPSKFRLRRRIWRESGQQFPGIWVCAMVISQGVRHVPLSMLAQTVGTRHRTQGRH